MAMNKPEVPCDLNASSEANVPSCRSAVRGGYHLLEAVLKSRASGVDMAVLLHFPNPCRLYILARIDPDLGRLTPASAWRAVMGSKPNIGATYERIPAAELDPQALFGIAIQAPNRRVVMSYYDAMAYESVLRAVERGGLPGRSHFDPAVN
jgi:hypothetical protein